MGRQLSQKTGFKRGNSDCICPHPPAMRVLLLALAVALTGESPVTDLTDHRSHQKFTLKVR